MKKRNQGKPQQKAHVGHITGFVTLSPSRKSPHPFCAYYGPHGETCSNTTLLQVVAVLPSSPPIVYMACILHYDDVHQTVQQFLDKLANLSTTGS